MGYFKKLSRVNLTFSLHVTVKNGSSKDLSFYPLQISIQAPFWCGTPTFHGPMKSHWMKTSPTHHLKKFFCIEIKTKNGRRSHYLWGKELNNIYGSYFDIRLCLNCNVFFCTIQGFFILSDENTDDRKWCRKRDRVWSRLLQWAPLLDVSWAHVAQAAALAVKRRIKRQMM